MNITDAADKPYLGTSTSLPTFADFIREHEQMNENLHALAIRAAQCADLICGGQAEAPTERGPRPTQASILGSMTNNYAESSRHIYSIESSIARLVAAI